MNNDIIIGIDLAKNVFQLHGAQRDGQVLFRKKLSRPQFAKFCAEQSPCLIAMEACATAHYWARELKKFGHEVRLIPPIYVKPFVKRHKNDAADAEAIGREGKHWMFHRSHVALRHRVHNVANEQIFLRMPVRQERGASIRHFTHPLLS